MSLNSQDISRIANLARLELRADESERMLTQLNGFFDIVEQMRAVTRFRGLQCRVQYAEGFTPCLTWLRATTRRLLP